MKFIASEYMHFLDHTPPGRKTKIISVCSKSQGVELGQIKWHGPWRQYCLFPARTSVIFNRGCLLDINAQMDSLMAERA